MRSFFWLTLVLASGCFDTSLPAAPVLGPGTVRATVLTALPGRAGLTPAKGAVVRLMGSSLEARADDDGNVLLAGVTVTKGRLVFSLDADGDGRADRSRVVTLESVRAGFGRDVNLGQLVLGRNSTVVGVVKRGDRAALASGHGGISVFLPELPQLTYTGDDGSYSLGGVPEGPIIINAFAAGYRPEAVSLEVGAGREERLDPLVLTADPGAPAVGSLTGIVRLEDGTLVSGVKVRGARAGQERSVETSGEGRFRFDALDVGVYALALEKPGYEVLRVEGVLVAAAMNEVGPFVLRPGMSGAVALDGGPAGPPDGGSGGGSAGGGTAGGTAGGATGGGSAGGSAGGTAGGATGGGSAGGAAGGATGGGSAGGAAGGATGGGGSAGGTAGGATGGGMAPEDAGIDAGVPPTAVVGPAQVVPANAIVTITGMASFGDFPLSYEWLQVAGPSVNLSVTSGVTAHSPTFRALVPAGTVLEFSLVVIDRFGRRSTNLAIARVAVGSVPTARFVSNPDASVVFGGSSAVLQSTSFDDGGLALVRHDWSLGQGSAATLIADGGPTALLSFDPLQPPDPDRLASVSLSVTNAIGATSLPTSRVFTVRALPTTNWSVTIAPQPPVLVGPAPGPITLNATLTTPPGAPTPTVSWSCMPAVALLNGNTVSPSFVPPFVDGPPVDITCVLTASGAPPLAPTQLTQNAVIRLIDQRPPTLLRSWRDPTRLAPWGQLLEFSEPMSSIGFVSCMLGGGQRVGRWMVPQPGEPGTPASCGVVSLIGTDLAGNPLPTTPITNAASASVVWEGPFVSTELFDDPRPVVASLGAVPSEQQRLAGVPAPRPAGVEVLAFEPGALVRLGSFDPYPLDAGCAPSCGMPATRVALPGVTDGVERRAVSTEASMFVVTATDAGATALERTPGGAWQGPSALPGTPFEAGGRLEAVGADGGLLSLWRWVPATRQWVATGQVDAGVSPILEVTGGLDFLLASAGTPARLHSWNFGELTANPGFFQWYPLPALPSPPSNPSRLTPVRFDYFLLRGAQYQRPDGTVGMYRTGQTGPLNVGQFVGYDFTWGGVLPVDGFDSVIRHDLMITAVSQQGDIRLSVFRANSWGGGDDTLFQGPPRAGPPPWPQALDLDPVCEAVRPRLALVEDVLFVTWQERCSPELRWRVVTRLVR
ncbi:MAG: carboxypeptidase regulatory-like domain-containing protein [Myxococcaceae bacterium]|nr:carboxypeptidase regulatory-like domain-containing protein [Myxococcaceae bacterium]